ncbi:hypothetical protein TRAPUB_4306 [Trametes pubescens]|uniref:F-box domain-containing protein n=1 Tax=Trametes pubescens TaxID=154538 RepID=A0A1M2W7D0_TRAPU|nr:hypothetical protein TRAPUB_4306 [Trametes pubescens]
MPYLEHLQIETDLYYPNPNKRIRDPDPYTYIMHASRFPVLRSLVVRDVYINMDMSLCRNLCFLHLGHGQKVARSLPLADFLYSLQSCVELKRLWVDRYIDISTPLGPRPPLLLQRLKQLTHIRFSDEPRVVSAILSQLVIPPHVDVATIAYAGALPYLAFQAMLPDDTDKLQIMRGATEISICDVEGRGRGTSAIIPGPNIAVAFRRELFPDNGFDLKRDHDGVLLAAMIGFLDVYKRSPVRTLKVVGNLRYTHPAHWATAFNCFPSLEVLEVEDTQPTPSPALYALFQALQATSGQNQQISACPRLRRFCFAGNIYSGHPLEMVYQCFSKRHDPESGTQPLRELVLQVNLDPDTEWRPALGSIYYKKLRSVVRTVDLCIVAPS